MKKAQICVILLLNVLTILAQPPESFKYQAVARDNTGNLLTNKNIAFRISILKGTAMTGAVYIEDHQKTTNGFGLVDLEIGKGSVRAGTFSAIGWGTDVFFVKVEMDPQGGVAFQHLGTSPLLSVPYALNAKTVEVEKDGDPLNEIQQLTATGNVLELSKGGGTVTLPSPPGDNWGSDYVHTDSTLEGFGTHASPLKISRNWAVPGQVLQWNGATWEPSTLSMELKLPYAGSVSSTDYAFEIINEDKGSAILGKVSGGRYTPGIVGESTDGFLGTGVVGRGNWIGVGGSVGKTDTTGVGVMGLSFAEWATGVEGNAQGKSVSIGVDGSALPIKGSELCIGVRGGVIADNPNSWAGYFSGRLVATGRTGIGTEYPEAGLHIKGKDWPESFAYLESESGFDAGIRLNEGGNKKWQIYNDKLSGSNGLHVVNGAGQSCMFISQGSTNVGIGSYSPSFKLEVAGPVNLNSGISWGAALHCDGAQALWYDGTYFSWGYGGTYNYFADKVTIGNAANPGNYMLYVQGNAFTTGTWSTSDIRFKKNVTEINDPLEKVMKIRGVTYEYRTGDFPEYGFAGGRHAGCIAQEVEEIFPEAVLTDSIGYKSLNYSELIPLLLEAVKEQQRIIERISADYTELKTKYNSVEKEIRLILERSAKEMGAWAK